MISILVQGNLIKAPTLVQAINTPLAMAIKINKNLVISTTGILNGGISRMMNGVKNFTE
jgi:hypothetical protein